MREDRIHPPISRGVYELPFRNRDGTRRIVAISRDGRLLAEASHVTRSGVGPATRMLRQMLDHEDPPVELRLMA